MKRIARYTGKGLAGLMYVAAYLVIYIGGFAIHMYVTWYAFESAGSFWAIVTLAAPFFAELFWLFPIAGRAGTWWNMYSAALILIVIAYMVLAVAGSILERTE